MANNNNNKMIEFETDSGKVQLSQTLVTSYIAKGSGFTAQEINSFMMLCQYRRLNPYLGEAHLIKYGGTCQQVVGLPVFQQRLNNHPKNKGFKLGVITIDENNVIQNREGTFYPSENEKLVGAYCEFKKSGYDEPFKWTVSLKDYQKMIVDKDTKHLRPQGQWNTMPAVMLTKCAFVGGIRYAYPEQFGGMYSSEELGVNDEMVIDVTPKTINQKQVDYLKTMAKSKFYNDEKAEKLISFVMEKAVELGYLKNTNIGEIPEEKFETMLSNLKTIKEKQEKKVEAKKIETENEDKVAKNLFSQEQEQKEKQKAEQKPESIPEQKEIEIKPETKPDAEKKKTKTNKKEDVKNENIKK